MQFIFFYFFDSLDNIVGRYDHIEPLPLPLPVLLCYWAESIIVRGLGTV